MARARVGSVGGLPSVADLKALLAAKDYEMTQLARAWGDYRQEWMRREEAVAINWADDYAALVNRYARAREDADRAISAAKYVPLGDGAIPAGDSYNGLLRALRKNWNGETGGELARGDFQDLDTRLREVGAGASYPNVPQPDPQSDVDIRAFQAADKATRAIERVTLGASSALPWVALGLLGAALLARSR